MNYTPATDQLGHSAPLEHSLSLPLLGVPLTMRSNSARVLALAERALGHWRELAPALIEPGPPLRVDFVVHPDDAQPEATARVADFVFRAHGDTFLAASGANLMSAAMAEGHALAFVTPALVADEASLRTDVIERLALLLSTRRDRIPVHAGAVVRNGRAVLLVGSSRVGKSTLCYACVRAGFQLLAEEVVQVSLAQGLRLWGNSTQLHLLPDAPRFFPELADTPAGARLDGKLTVDLAALAPARLVTHAETALVCLLERRTGQASELEPIPAALAAAALSDIREPGFNPLRDQALAAATALVAGGAYRLRVGNNPSTAVALLEHLTA